MHDGMLNMRIKCGPKKCICSYVTSCLSQIDLIIDLFWEIGYRYQKGSCRNV